MSDMLHYLLIVASVLLIRSFVASFARVKGNSMLPTLENGDWLLVWRLGVRLHGPKRQDVVICRYPGRYWKNLRLLPMAFVKRVIGLPGESIEWVEGTVHVDGRPLHEPYLDPQRARFCRTRAPRAVEPGRYFVLGDNRDRSNDSRSVGALTKKAVRGRVVCIVWPPRRMGRVR